MRTYLTTFETLLSSGDAADRENAILMALMAFERFRGCDTLFEEFGTFDPTPEENQWLIERLCSQYKQDVAAGADTHDIVWALGKTGDISLKPLFVESLKRCLLAGRDHELLESLRALREVDDDSPFPSHAEPIVGASYSTDTFELNRELATRYLKTRGFLD